MATQNQILGPVVAAPVVLAVALMSQPAAAGVFSATADATLAYI